MPGSLYMVAQVALINFGCYVLLVPVPLQVCLARKCNEGVTKVFAHFITELV